MRRVILAICATAVVLVLLLSFKSHTQSVPAASSSAAGSPPVTTPGAAPAASASSSGKSSAGSGAAVTVTGAAWPTVYGPVQVRITVSGGRVTAVTAVEYPTGTPRDVQINQFAIPQLNAETLAAGNARIDSVSGATYTSQGYLGSLQNALDKISG